MFPLHANSVAASAIQTAKKILDFRWVDTSSAHYRGYMRLQLPNPSEAFNENGAARAQLIGTKAEQGFMTPGDDPGISFHDSHSQALDNKTRWHTPRACHFSLFSIPFDACRRRQSFLFSVGTERPSSIGKDDRFSFCKEGFNSPRACQFHLRLASNICASREWYARVLHQVEFGNRRDVGDEEAKLRFVLGIRVAVFEA